MIQEFWHVLLDPAHMLAELVSSIIIDVLFIFLVYQTLIKKVLVPRWHKKFDQEHGINHPQIEHEHKFEYQKYVSVMGEIFPEAQSYFECKCGEGFWTAPKTKDKVS